MRIGSRVPASYFVSVFRVFRVGKREIRKVTVSVRIGKVGENEKNRLKEVSIPLSRSFVVQIWRYFSIRGMSSWLGYWVDAWILHRPTVLFW